MFATFVVAMTVELFLITATKKDTSVVGYAIFATAHLAMFEMTLTFYAN